MEQSSAISNRKFYGKSSLAWKVRLQRKEKEFEKHTVPLDYRPIIDGPPADWKCFYRQQDAFTYARQKAESLHVFAYESSTFMEQHGQRLYLVASYPQFWHYYRQLPTTKRHHYEVIPYGSVCRLYFDLEFSVAHNPRSDGVKVTENFIKFICGLLSECFSISCSSSNVLQLDASTSEKFSRHLIFHLPCAVFHDNIQAGNFVQHCARSIWNCRANTLNQDKENITQETSPPKRPKRDESGTREGFKASEEQLNAWGLQQQDVLSFIVKDKHEKDALFCDTGVYTKNRNFRLYRSCKWGKQNPLVLARENQFEPDVPETKLEQQIFLDSLVTNIDFNTATRILTFEDNSEGATRSVGAAHGSNTKSEGSLQGYQSSPYPELDAFIEGRVHEGGVAGHVRRWSYFPQAEVMLYDIGWNRWCQNVGRPHKSNNIMMIADLKNSVFYQKCHDPECKGYKSPEMPIPESVLPSHHLEEEDLAEMEEDVTDEDLVNALNFMEQSTSEEDCKNDALNSNNGTEARHNVTTKRNIVTKDSNNVSSPCSNVDLNKGRKDSTEVAKVKDSGCVPKQEGGSRENNKDSMKRYNSFECESNSVDEALWQATEQAETSLLN